MDLNIFNEKNCCCLPSWLAGWPLALFADDDDRSVNRVQCVLWTKFIKKKDSQVKKLTMDSDFGFGFFLRAHMFVYLTIFNIEN